MRNAFAFRLKTVRPRISEYWTDIHTETVYSNTWEDVIIYFQAEVIAKTLSTILLPTASSGILEKGLG